MNSLFALRLNETAFNFTLDVIYTGVGSGRGLALIDVQFRERSGNNWFHHGATIELTASQYSREIWCGVASNDNFAMIEDVEFFVSIKNTANLVTTMTAYQELGKVLIRSTINLFIFYHYKMQCLQARLRMCVF